MATQRKVLRFPFSKEDPKGQGIRRSKGRQPRRRTVRDRNMTTRYADRIEGIRREFS
jgi:hypothetical protein